MTPEEVRKWQRVIRDFAMLAVGIFMLVYETVGTETPNEWLVGAGLTAVGLVPAFQFDEWRRRQSRNGSSGDGRS